MFNIGYLSSGELGFQTLQELNGVFIPKFIATDAESTDLINYANTEKIPCFTGNPRKGRLKRFLGDGYYELMLSVNYLFILEQDILDLSKYTINLHGSLLPKYRGRTPHVWAIINSEKWTGVTAHFISRECDAGDIVKQIAIPIEEFDTGAVVLDKFKKIYPEVIKEIFTKIIKGNLDAYPQQHENATYFGKRTPKDGKIDWNWQKERIHNWVRAQAKPYPGAFTYFEGEKIIIDEISFDELGFSDNIKNGSILSLNPIRVKTQNGVIRITKIRSKVENIEVNKLFE